MQNQLEILRAFNEKVARLERTRFAKKYKDGLPEVLMTFDDLKIESLGESQLHLSGKLKSWVPEFDEDEIDAFVLTYRILTQNNDRLSLANVARVYQADWMHPQAAANFSEARRYLNNHLDSAATMEFGSTQISIRAVIDVVLYGGLTHTNQQKAEVFNTWVSNPAISGLMWVEFMGAMRKALFVFSFVRRLNEAVLQATT